LVAKESKATTDPSAEIVGSKLARFAGVPSGALVTSEVVFVLRSRR